MTCGKKHCANAPTEATKVDHAELDGRPRCIHAYCRAPLQGDECPHGHSQTTREAEVYVAFLGRQGEEPYTVEVPIVLDDAAAQEQAMRLVQAQIEAGGMWEQVEQIEFGSLETIAPVVAGTEAASGIPTDRATAAGLWAQLGAVPVDEEGEIDEPFLHFPRGTQSEDIWHWFEQHFGLSVVDDLGMGRRGDRWPPLQMAPSAAPSAALPARVREELAQVLGEWVEFHEAAGSPNISGDDRRSTADLAEQSQALLTDPQVAASPGGNHLRRLLMFYEEFLDGSLEDSAWRDWEDEVEEAWDTAHALHTAPTAEEVAAAQGYEHVTQVGGVRVYHDYIHGGEVISQYHYTVYSPEQDRMASFDVRDLYQTVESERSLLADGLGGLAISRWSDHPRIIVHAVAALGDRGFAAWLREHGQEPLRETTLSPAARQEPWVEPTPQEMKDLAARLWGQVEAAIPDWRQRRLSTWYPAHLDDGAEVEVMLTLGVGRNNGQEYLRVQRTVPRIIREAGRLVQEGDAAPPERRREAGTTTITMIINRNTGETKESR